MKDKAIALRGSSELRNARRGVSWVGDDDLDELEDREPYAAAAMSLAFPGSGHIYNHNYLPGFAILAASVAAIAIVPYGVIPYLAAGIASAVVSFRKSRLVNRFIKARWRENQHPEHADKSTRLARAMKRRQPQLAAAAGPSNVTAAPNSDLVAGPNSELVGSLHKLATLHRGGMITDLEYSNRKIDVISETATALPQSQLEDLLLALMPLRDLGSLDDNDIAFIKSLNP